MGTWFGKGNNLRSATTTTFGASPLSDGLLLDIPASDYNADPRAQAAAYGWTGEIRDDAALEELIARNRSDCT